MFQYIKENTCCLHLDEATRFIANRLSHANEESLRDKTLSLINSVDNETLKKCSILLIKDNIEVK